jgi:hypothetical protein
MTVHVARWSAEDVQKLKNLAGKYPRESIAAYLGRGPSSVGGKARRLGISLRVKRKLRRRVGAEVNYAE